MTISQIRQRYGYSFILLKQLVKTDFKLRYQGSALGYVWSLLRPLLMFVTLYVVFTYFLKVGNDIPHKSVYLLLGIVLWNYFGEVTSGSVGAIVGKGDLLRKINFPKYIIIFSGSLSALINLALNFVVVAIFMFFNHVTPHWSALLLIPLVVELFIVSIAFAFFLSALFVRFRDLSYIWDVVMQAGFYGTPILYPLSGISHLVAKFLILSPMAQIIQDARYVLVTHNQPTIGMLYGNNALIWTVPFGSTLVVAICGALYFRKRSKYFAEEV